MSDGGPSIPVLPVNDRAAGAGPALRVIIVSDGRPLEAGPARPVVVVSDGRPTQGNVPMPVVLATGVQASRVLAGPAIPIVVMNGGSLAPNMLYANKVNALSPIAYWPLAEPSGAVALDESGNGRNGAYTAVSLAQPGIGDGRTAASFDGTTSYCNVYGASLAAAFGAAEGTIAGWMKVSGAAFWSDVVTTRRMAYFLADTNNRVYLQKTTTANQLAAVYIAGGVNKSINFTTSAPLTFFHFALTWSKAADQFKFYINGVQVGSTLTGLGTWAGALSSTNATIGCGGIGPFNVHDGSLAHAAIWDRPLSAASIALLATP